METALITKSGKPLAPSPALPSLPHQRVCSRHVVAHRAREAVDELVAGHVRSTSAEMQFERAAARLPTDCLLLSGQ